MRVAAVVPILISLACACASAGAGDDTAGRDGASEQAAKQAGAVAPVAPHVDAAALATLSPSLLSDRARAAALSSPVPVLLPTEAALLDTAHIAAGDGWYTAWLSAPDHHVGLFGTRRAIEVPGATPADGLAIDARTPLVTISEGVPSISFVRAGVAYRLEVECAGGPTAPGCATVDRLFELYESLAVLDRAVLDRSGALEGAP